MLHSKGFWILVALAFGGFAFSVMRSGHNKDQQVEDAISLLKQGNDRSRDCEAFGKLVALAPESSQATLMIGEMYARGICHPFDLEKSLEWYRKGSLSNEQIGSALFRAAMWEVPPGEKGLSQEQLTALLQKAKEFGHHPTKNDLDRLPSEYARIFQ
jgi:TPR repeat protein